MDQETFNSLLAAFLNPDNEQRRQAEVKFDELHSDVPKLMDYLMTALTSAREATSRSMAAVLLRRLLERKTGHTKAMPAEFRESVKKTLLDALKTEETQHIRRQICHTIAELAATACDPGLGGWPGLIETIQWGSQQGPPQVQALTLLLLQRVAEYVGKNFATQYSDVIQTILKQALQDDRHHLVRVAALQACTSVISAMPSVEMRENFIPAVPSLMKALRVAISENEYAAQDALKSLIELAITYPKIMKPFLVPACKELLDVGRAGDLEPGTRMLALEFLLQLFENAGGMVRKEIGIVDTFIKLAVSLVCEVEDDPDWEKQLESPRFYSGDDESQLVSFGEEAVDRIARHMGSQIVYPRMMNIVTELSKGTWKQKRAALITVGLIGEGCKQDLARQIKKVVSLVLPFFEDPHPRVRYAAIHAIGQLALDLGGTVAKKVPNFQKAVNKQVVPALTKACSGYNAQYPRVRAQAAAALVNVANPQFCKPRQLEPVDPLLQALYSVIRECRRDGQEAGLTAVACVAQVLEDDFAKYYDRFFPISIDILANSTAEDEKLLRGKAMEMAGILCCSVGKDNCLADANRMMELLVSKEKELATDSEGYRYLMQAFARMAQCLGHDFLPYIHRIFPKLLQTAGQQIKVIRWDTDDKSVNTEGLDQYEFVESGQARRTVGVDSAAMQDKATAANIVYTLVDNLNQYLWQHVDKITDVIIPLLQFKLANTTRAAAICTTPRLIECALEDPHNPRHAQQILNTLVPAMLEYLIEEKELEMANLYAEAFAEMMRVCKDSGSPPRVMVPLAHVHDVVSTLGQVIDNSVGDRLERVEEVQADEDYDAVVAMALAEEQKAHDELVTSVVDAIGFLIRAHGPSIMDKLKDFLPLVMKMLSVDNVPPVKGSALCIIDDLLEFASPPAAEALLAKVMPEMLKGASHPTVVVRQACVYGLGVAGSVCGPLFEPFVNDAVKALIGCIKAPDAMEEDNAEATDNAISALIKIMETWTARVDVPHILSIVLRAIPLFNDHIEAAVVHAWFIKSIINGKEAIVGPGWKNLPKCLELVGQMSACYFDILEETEGEAQILDEQTRKAMSSLPSTLKSKAPGPVLDNALKRLPQRIKQAIMALGEQ